MGITDAYLLPTEQIVTQRRLNKIRRRQGARPHSAMAVKPPTSPPPRRRATRHRDRRPETLTSGALPTSCGVATHRISNEENTMAIKNVTAAYATAVDQRVKVFGEAELGCSSARGAP